MHLSKRAIVSGQLLSILKIMGPVADPSVASRLAAAGVPAFKCPPGTKMHILDLGTLQVDEGWYVAEYNLIGM